MTKRMNGLGIVVALAVLAAGCAAGKAFRQAEEATQRGDLDNAVVAYRRAVQAAPENADYKIALQRAMLAASRAHLDRAREYEQRDQLDAALGEYRLASEYDPSNRLVAAKVAEVERTIRDRLEAARPKSPVQQARAAAAAAVPTLSPTARLRLLRFNNTSVRDILNFIGTETGINILFDQGIQDRPYTVQLDDVTIEQALNQILGVNQLSYKVINEKTIFVFQDTPANHVKYDEQVIQTFYLQNADATEMSQVLSGILRLPQMPIQPGIVINQKANSLTIRATQAVLQILDKVIQQNDKPRAEIVVDVEILEVDRSRAKQYGLNLSDYAIGGIFSPEVSPTSTTTPTSGGTTPGTGTTTTPGATTTTSNTGRSTTPEQTQSPPPFNLNTISRGVSTADFYLAVPTAIVRFLESDTRTKVLAKPQLRGSEGSKMTLNLGQRIPVVSTSFTPIASGGAGINPLASYQYQDVGINLDMTPRVTVEGDVQLDITVDDSAVGADKSVAGTTVPTFVQRKVTTRLRLRDGESNLLAGLLQDNETSVTTGFPGAIHVPILRDLFSGNSRTTDQTDIVMLLTPHIIRTQQITEADLKPFFIGSQQTLGLGGPPPLIAPPPEPTPAPAAPPARPGPPVVAPPPGSSPVPGTVVVPPPPTEAAAPPGAQPPAGQPPPGQQPTQPAAAQPPGVGAPPAAPPEAQQPITSPGVGVAQVILTPPGPTFRVGQGPYNVPISVTGAQRLSTVTLTLTFDPSILRVRTIQEGSFMRAGGVVVAFSQQVNGPRIDITITRAADATGASGTGLLAAILFDAVGPGSTTLTLSGAATGPGGTAMGLQFRPVTVTVQR